MKEQPKEVHDAWDTLLNHGIPIKVPIEWLMIPSCEMVDNITLVPFFITNSDN